MSEPKDWSKRWEEPAAESRQAGPKGDKRIGGMIVFAMFAMLIFWMLPNGKPEAAAPAITASSPLTLPEIGQRYMTAGSCFGSARFEDRQGAEKALKDPEGFPAAVMSGRLLGVEKSELVRVIDTRSDGLFDTVWVNVRRMNEPSITLWIRHDCLTK